MNSRKWGYWGNQKKKKKKGKKQKHFYSKKICKLKKKSEFFHSSRTNPWDKFNCPRIFKKSKKANKQSPFIC